ncbi:hypothetical protein ACWEO4_40940 [Streptomyces sp. NPDC004393]|uniref:hypothetical protein n=1 Tax=unclassified Streptomyces TaxID=2593676 RepID=UPI0033A95F41
MSDMIERGVEVGEPDSDADGDLIPWSMSKDEALNHIAREMAIRDDPGDFIDICWFKPPR